MIQNHKIVHKFFKYIKIIFESLKNEGIKSTLKKIYCRLCDKHIIANRYAKPLLKKDLELHKNYTFSKNIVFSILVPLYNTNERMLQEMIESVLNQSYAQWELCLVDASDEKHNYVKKIVEKYAQNERRIKYKKLARNFGIAENTKKAIEIATGNYFSLLDHDDVLAQSALFETARVIQEQNAQVVYTDEAVFEKKITKIKNYSLKPDFSPSNLCNNNYITHFLTFEKTLYAQTDGFCSDFDGAQDYDIVLKLSEKTHRIVHIHKILYFWRAHPNSTAQNSDSKNYAELTGRKALEAHLQRCGIEGEVLETQIPCIYRINYRIQNNPKVSILIPNKDNVELLKTCINSILQLSTYKNIEIFIIENNSTEQKTFDFYAELKQQNIKILTYAGEFNYSKINNFGAHYATGDYILLLNNDTKIITPDWIEQMLMICQQKNVGVVGAKLLYADDTIQHAGVVIGMHGLVGHIYRFYEKTARGNLNCLVNPTNYSAVTGACLLTKKTLWQELGGLDEQFAVAYNDVDFCLRIRRLQKTVVFTPYAELYHYESKTRGYDDESPEKRAREKKEAHLFYTKWKSVIDSGDPYFNKNFSLKSTDIRIR